MNMIKKISLAFIIVLISSLSYITVFAGTWTKTGPDGHEYARAVSYIKNDGTYAIDEWVQDTDGTYYWVEYDGALPARAGISTDGYMFDSLGRYIDFTDGSRKYFDPDALPAFQAGTSYEQVISQLGQPHSTVDYNYYYSNTYETDRHTSFTCWYTQEMNGSLAVTFKGDQVYCVEYYVFFN